MGKSYLFSISVHIIFIFLLIGLFSNNLIKYSEKEPREKIFYSVNLVSSSPEEEERIGVIEETDPLVDPDIEEITTPVEEEINEVEENINTQLPVQTGGNDPINVNIPGIDINDPYIKTLVRKVSRNYRDPLRLGAPSKKVTVSFNINQDGSISNVLISESSNDDIFDLAGLRAVKAAAPFQPLPSQFGNSINVFFYFEHN